MTRASASLEEPPTALANQLRTRHQIILIWMAHEERIDVEPPLAERAGVTGAYPLGGPLH
jgi:hypothetical protein